MQQLVYRFLHMAGVVTSHSVWPSVFVGSKMLGVYIACKGFTSHLHLSSRLVTT